MVVLFHFVSYLYATGNFFLSIALSRVLVLIEKSNRIKSFFSPGFSLLLRKFIRFVTVFLTLIPKENKKRFLDSGPRFGFLCMQKNLIFTKQSRQQQVSMFVHRTLESFRGNICLFLNLLVYSPVPFC